ncbi:MAG: glutaredoxin [Gammaproteobacteria bacterium]|jgi:glutaredoxin|nr:glutaredoxin [Gammaproteobacteria bacterium]
MKQLIRLFFRVVRVILGPLLLLWEWLAPGTRVARSEEAQRKVDEASSRLTLYQYRTCPFCIKTRRAIKRLSLPIRTLDAQHDQSAREALRSGGGEVKVPCLRIEEDDGQVRWLYESNAIIDYLQARFS